MDKEKMNAAAARTTASEARQKVDASKQELEMKVVSCSTEYLIEQILKDVLQSVGWGEDSRLVGTLITEDGTTFFQWKDLNDNIKTDVINELKRLGYSVENRSTGFLGISW